jgi:hypothetical protein
MPLVDCGSMNKWLKTSAPFILTVAVAFFLFELYLLINSFQADCQICQRVSFIVARSGLSWPPILWLSSELIGEVGLIIRFTGAIFFLGFAVTLLLKKKFALSHLRKAVFLEAAQYLFFIPFLIYLFILTNASTTNYLAATSYCIQLLLIFPVFMVLFVKLRKSNLDSAVLFKWSSIAVVCFTFALWAKHFIFAFYALPLSFQNPFLLLGFLNSTLTMLVGAALLLFALKPMLTGKGVVNSKIVGAALCCLGAYFVVYLLISAVNSTYLSFVTLIELWGLSLLVLGLGFVKQKIKGWFIV